MPSVLFSKGTVASNIKKITEPGTLKATQTAPGQTALSPRALIPKINSIQTKSPEQ